MATTFWVDLANIALGLATLAAALLVLVGVFAEIVCRWWGRVDR